MVVVAILAIMAGAIVPRLNGGADQQRLDAASQVVADALRYCYSAAVTEGRLYRWVWDSQAQRARYFREGDPLEQPGEFVPALAGQRRDEALPDGVRLDGVYFVVANDAQANSETDLEPEITFFPDGHATTAYVVLTALAESEEIDPQDASNTVTVMINGVTGRVRRIPGNVMAAAAEQEDRYEYGDYGYGYGDYGGEAGP